MGIDDALFAMAFASTVGTGLMCLLAIIGAVLRWGDPGSSFLLLGGAVYLAGSIGVTMVVNVPMNDALAAVDAESEEGKKLWHHYLRRWTAWNHVRTAACVMAMVLLMVGMCA